MKKNIFLFILTSLFSISSQAVNPQKGNYFLYCHMSDKGQWTAYAVSKDAENWEDIIGGDSIFSSFKLAGIEGGTRDAYISRSWDGKRYVMVTTDMNNSKTKALGKKSEWHNYGIDLLTSDDLIHWKSTTLSYVWPDGKKGGYFIYYSILNSAEDKYDRMYYSYADKSFTKLTQPRLLFDWGYATIDADINYVPADGLYHMMIKKEGGKKGLFTATAPKLTGPWGEPVEDDYVSFEGKKNCEGVSAFQVPGEDGWRIAYIEYSSNPKHYRICKADKFMRNFRDPQDIKGVTAPQHGSFMRITKKEYNRLKAWSEAQKKNKK